MRLSAHKLMIEKGRHLRLKLEDRTCPKCTLNMIEDEFHAVMICPAYLVERTKLFNVIQAEHNSWASATAEEKFLDLMKVQHHHLQIGQFLHHIITSGNAASN